MATALLSRATSDAVTSILSPYNPPTPSDVKENSAAFPPPHTFSFTPYLHSQSLTTLISTTPVCPAYAAGHCPLGRRCPDRHPTADAPKTTGNYHGGRNDNYVCKHWLKALCKKGASCDFLHEYNMRKMNECQFYNQNGYCQNGDECLYLHVKEESRLPLCEEYNKGLCEKGPWCGKRHVRRKLCEAYMAGFCPEGKECKIGVHLKSTVGVPGETEEEKERRKRVEDLERREEDERRNAGWGAQKWKGGRKVGKGGAGGRWAKRDRG